MIIALVQKKQRRVENGKIFQDNPSFSYNSIRRNVADFQKMLVVQGVSN
jgi:hypothetical protein